jgi:hypothetical protein
MSACGCTGSSASYGGCGVWSRWSSAILTGGGDTGLGLPTGFEIPNGEARLEALPGILDLEIKLEATIRDTERFLWELKQRPLGQDAVAPQKEGEPKQQPIQEVPINSEETLRGNSPQCCGTEAMSAPGGD